MNFVKSSIRQYANHTNPWIRMPFIAMVGLPILVVAIAVDAAEGAWDAIKDGAPVFGKMWRLMIHGPKRGA